MPRMKPVQWIRYTSAPSLKKRGSGSVCKESGEKVCVALHNPLNACRMQGTKTAWRLKGGRRLGPPLVQVPPGQASFLLGYSADWRRQNRALGLAENGMCAGRPLPPRSSAASIPIARWTSGRIARAQGWVPSTRLAQTGWPCCSRWRLSMANGRETLHKPPGPHSPHFRCANVTL